ncbi:guanine-N(1)--methyltransferase [Calycina marina]|uniref:tRNA (guanine(9)-N1)-methyltransferase n=1 Tax=Calycina marina TaxID=1763456 RepID=A0A9P7Z2S8_9HELO|nr:guanine-N(1)--methyltransferase [Calycina marina]
MSDSEGNPFKIRKLTHSEDDTAAVIPKISTMTGIETETITAVDNQLRKEMSAGESDPNVSIQSPERPTLSHNALKKLRKAQAWEADIENRRARRREKHKEKQARKKLTNEEKRQVEAAAIAAGIVVEKKKEPMRPIQVPIGIMLDCDFEQYMTEKEMVSLGAQLTRSYSENRKNQQRTHLVITSWGGALEKRFQTVMANTHLGWKINFTEDDFVAAANDLNPVLRGLSEQLRGNTCSGHVSGKTEEENDSSGIPAKQSSRLKLKEPSVVYLTADSPHTLERLSPYTTYVIGAIVDKNRHKGLCYKRACERGIPTARLPIGEYMTMQHRSVLAVNHVVEIMLKWLETGDWGEAFVAVIPKRKEAVLRTRKNALGESVNGNWDGDCDDEVDETEEVDTGEGQPQGMVDGEPNTENPSESFDVVDIQPAIISTEETR